MKKLYMMLFLLASGCNANTDQVNVLNNFIEECDVPVEYIKTVDVYLSFKSTHGLKCGNKFLSFNATLYILPYPKGNEND